MSATLSATLTTVPTVKHEAGNVRADKRGEKNTLNNRKFAVLSEQKEITPMVPATETTPEVPATFAMVQSMIEIVRSGKNHMRIRRDLTTNGETCLVATKDISDIQKRSKTKVEVAPVA